jgi:cytosine deaminase
MTRDGVHVDVLIRNGQIEDVVDAGTADESAFVESDCVNANGRLITPTFTEPHTHLDSALTVEAAGENKTGTLEEGWEKWQDLRDDLTADDVKKRARTAIEWFAANGVTRVRSHVDVTASHWQAVDALLELREEVAGLVDLQLVAFPIDSVVHDPDTYSQIEQALNMGVDVVGGLPHGEHTREAGVEHVRRIVELADEFDRPLDLHIDETDDPNSRFTETLAVEVRKRGLGYRTTASHVTAMHSYPNAYARKVAHLLSDVGISVVTNPLSNAILQGRYDDFPRRRGHTRIRQLRKLDIPVAIGQDDIVDSTYQYGDGDPLTAAHVLLHFTHMNQQREVSDLWDMLLEESAQTIGVDNYGLKEGAEGSVIIHGGTDPFDILRTRVPRTLVVKDGIPIAKNKKSTTLLTDEDRQIDFTKRDI